MADIPEEQGQYRQAVQDFGISRANHYYKPKGKSETNHQIVKNMYKEHMEHLVKGVIGMADFLLESGFMVSRHKIRRLMDL